MVVGAKHLSASSVKNMEFTLFTLRDFSKSFTVMNEYQRFHTEYKTSFSAFLVTVVTCTLGKWPQITFLSLAS